MNLKNLKSLFIVTDEPEEKKPETQETKNQPATPSPTHPVSTTKPTDGAFDDRIAESLFGALEKNNLEGFDYFEFKNSLKALAKMPLDEATRFRSAFATASTMGLTVEKLLQTADHYLKVLEKEQITFMSTVSQQRNQNVNSKETGIEGINKLIQEKSAQIKKLTEEIQQHQQEIQKEREEIALAKTRIEAAESNFKRTYTSVISQMNEDVMKIKQYLQSPE